MDDFLDVDNQADPLFSDTADLLDFSPFDTRASPLSQNSPKQKCNQTLEEMHFHKHQTHIHGNHADHSPIDPSTSHKNHPVKKKFSSKKRKRQEMEHDERRCTQLQDKKPNLTKDEKKELKMLKNRLSAARSRQKKAKVMDDLNKKVQHLEENKQQLEARLHNLEAENASLKQKFSEENIELRKELEFYRSQLNSSLFGAPHVEQKEAGPFYAFSGWILLCVILFAVLSIWGASHTSSHSSRNMLPLQSNGSQLFGKIPPVNIQQMMEGANEPSCMVLNEIFVPVHEDTPISQIDSDLEILDRANETLEYLNFHRSESFQNLDEANIPEEKDIFYVVRDADGGKRVQVVMADRDMICKLTTSTGAEPIKHSGDGVCLTMASLLIAKSEHSQEMCAAKAYFPIHMQPKVNSMDKAQPPDLG